MTASESDNGYSIEPTSHGHLQVLRLVGEFDLKAAPDLREAIVAALAVESSSGPLLIDMEALDFLDSTIISVLLTGVQEGQQTGREIRLAGVAPHVSRILGVTGIGGVLPSYPTLDEAAAG